MRRLLGSICLSLLAGSCAKSDFVDDVGDLTGVATIVAQTIEPGADSEGSVGGETQGQPTGGQAVHVAGTRGLLIQNADGNGCFGPLNNSFTTGAQIYLKDCVKEPKTIWHMDGGFISPDGVHCAASAPNNKLELAICASGDVHQQFEFDYRTSMYVAGKFFHAGTPRADGLTPITADDCPSSDPYCWGSVRLVGADAAGNGELLAYRGNPQACLTVVSNSLALQPCDASNVGQRWLSWQRFFTANFGFNQGRLCCNVAQESISLVPPSAQVNCDNLAFTPPVGLMCQAVSGGTAVPVPDASNTGVTLKALDYNVTRNQLDSYTGFDFWTYGGPAFINRQTP